MTEPTEQDQSQEHHNPIDISLFGISIIILMLLPNNKSVINSEGGALPLLVIIAIVGVLGFLAISSYAPFKDALFGSLYPKPSSNASESKGASPDNPGKPLTRATDHILVKFQDNIGQAKKAEVLAAHNLKQTDEISQIGVKIVNIPAGKTPEQAVSELQTNNPNDIEFASVDGIVTATFTPNDPNYPDQWQLAKINAPTAWDSVDGTGITIAIADSGVEPTHPDLAANLVPGWNFVNNNSDTHDWFGHGTAVAGSAAAVGNNANQVASPAYNAKIMPLMIAAACSGSACAQWSTVAKAITYAADHGAKIVNVSYGSVGWCADTDNTILSAAKYMYNKGGLTTFAEGNGGGNTNCANSSVIVSSSNTDQNDQLSGSSTYGSNVDVGSPGAAVLTTSLGGGIGPHGGTSFSSPITAGILALIWQTNPGLNPGQATEVLTKSADDLGTAGYDIYFGYGRVNAGNAVALAKTYVAAPLPSSTPTPSSTPKVRGKSGK